MAYARCPRLLTLAILPAVLLVGGCDQAWQAYEQVKLGQPVPADNLIVRKGTTQPDQATWNDFGGIPLPPVYGSYNLSILTDSQKNVVAKRYFAVAMGHWMLLQTWAVRTVIEVKIGPDRNAADASGILGYILEISRRLEQVNPQTDADFRNLPFLTQMWLASAAGMMAGSRAFRVDQLIDQQAELGDLGKPGFDRRLTNQYGASARIRNLGCRIIRIDFNYVYVADPLGLVAIKQMHEE